MQNSVEILRAASGPRADESWPTALGATRLMRNRHGRSWRSSERITTTNGHTVLGGSNAGGIRGAIPRGDHGKRGHISEIIWQNTVGGSDDPNRFAGFVWLIAVGEFLPIPLARAQLRSAMSLGEPRSQK